MAESNTFKPVVSRRSSVSDNASAADKLKQMDLENQKQQVGSGSDTEGEIGRQIEMESENSIKYRTCSWQKVCTTIRFEAAYACDARRVAMADHRLVFH